MFSIARFTGDNEEEKDTRTLEKKQERLNKLNARVSSKKRKDDSTDHQPEIAEKKIKAADQVQKKSVETKKLVEIKKTTEKTMPTDTKKSVEAKKRVEKTHTKKQKVVVKEVADKENAEDEGTQVDPEAEDENEDENAEDDEDNEEEEGEGDEEEETEAEAMEVDQTVTEEDVPTLEAFPDMVKPKTKRSKEETKMLKSMGIPEWMLQPTVVSPKESCGLDKAGLSPHLVQRCQDLGLSSLFAGR
jgi:hypothetical protein